MDARRAVPGLVAGLALTALTACGPAGGDGEACEAFIEPYSAFEDARAADDHDAADQAASRFGDAISTAIEAAESADLRDDFRTLDGLWDAYSADTSDTDAGTAFFYLAGQIAGTCGYDG